MRGLSLIFSNTIFSQVWSSSSSIFNWLGPAMDLLTVFFTQLVTTVQTCVICFVIIQIKFIHHGLQPFVFYSIYPWATHRYFIESISESIHVKTLLCTHGSFCDFLCKSPKLSIRLLYNLSLNDHRTVLCKNIFNISCECNVERLFLNKSYVRSVMKYADSPDNNWGIPLLNFIQA